MSAGKQRYFEVWKKIWLVIGVLGALCLIIVLGSELNNYIENKKPRLVVQEFEVVSIRDPWDEPCGFSQENALVGNTPVSVNLDTIDGPITILVTMTKSESVDEVKDPKAAGYPDFKVPNDNNIYVTSFQYKLIYDEYVKKNGISLQRFYVISSAIQPYRGTKKVDNKSWMFFRDNFTLDYDNKGVYFDIVTYAKPDTDVYIKLFDKLWYRVDDGWEG